jgi:hypothetical protein
MAYDDIPLVVVLFIEGDTKALEEIEKIETEAPPPLRDYMLLSSSFFETLQGIRALRTESHWQSTEADRLGY